MKYLALVLILATSGSLWWWTWTVRNQIVRGFFSGYFGRDLALRFIPAFVWVMWLGPLSLVVGNVSDPIGLVLSGLLVLGIAVFWLAPMPKWWGPWWLREDNPGGEMA